MNRRNKGFNSWEEVTLTKEHEMDGVQLPAD